MLHPQQVTEAGPSRLPIQRPTAYDRFSNTERNLWIDGLLDKIQKGLHPPESPGPSRSPTPFQADDDAPFNTLDTLDVLVEDGSSVPEDEVNVPGDPFEEAMQQSADLDLRQTGAAVDEMLQDWTPNNVASAPPLELDPGGSSYSIDPSFLAQVVQQLGAEDVIFQTGVQQLSGDVQAAIDSGIRAAGPNSAHEQDQDEPEEAIEYQEDELGSEHGANGAEQEAEGGHDNTGDGYEVEEEYEEDVEHEEDEEDEAQDGPGE